MLIENLFCFLRLHPLRIFQVITWLFMGKVYFKSHLADAIIPDVTKLPYQKTLLAWLKKQRSLGAKLVLATASDTRIAHKVAAHLAIFDDVLATKDINLSSKNKRDELLRCYGAKGFEYVGNSTADLAVWKEASAIHIVNPELGALKAARKIGTVNMIFNDRPPYCHTLIKALRIHQWAKNVLIFVPLLASHRIMELQLLCDGGLAFIAFGTLASSVYLLNDLLDLADDRKHHSKFTRPLAAGTFPILHALLLIPALLLGAFVIALGFLPPQFTGVLIIYYILTLFYSLWLKRVVMLDVVILAMLYVIRVIAGATAMPSLVTTFWILAFCTFIFLSLAFVKRYTELCDARHKGNHEKASGRGYYPADFELLASLGGSAGYTSVLVLALYINDASSGSLYKSPEWMWGVCPLLLFWLSRIWLLAHRGQMHDDPIIFALRDTVSRWIGLMFIIFFTLATF
jgi:4-hydroxybenzoate polyprenyltransferase